MNKTYILSVEKELKMVNLSKYPKVKSIKVIYMGIGHFAGKYGIVTAQNGQQYYYQFELSNSWEDENDWLDNICYDFQNEYDENDKSFGTKDMELFAVFDDEALKYFYE